MFGPHFRERVRFSIYDYRASLRALQATLLSAFVSTGGAAWWQSAVPLAARTPSQGSGTKLLLRLLQRPRSSLPAGAWAADSVAKQGITIRSHRQ